MWRCSTLIIIYRLSTTFYRLRTISYRLRTNKNTRLFCVVVFCIFAKRNILIMCKEINFIKWYSMRITSETFGFQICIHSIYCLKDIVKRKQNKYLDNTTIIKLQHYEKGFVNYWILHDMEQHSMCTNYGEFPHREKGLREFTPQKERFFFPLPQERQCQTCQIRRTTKCSIEFRTSGNKNCNH